MLQAKIEKALWDSLKKKKAVRVSTLRLLVSQIKNVRIEKKADLTDEEVVAIIKREIKARDEAIELYKKGGRDDLVKKEEVEKQILQAYVSAMPGQFSDKEVQKVIDEILEKTPENSNFGQIMGKVMAEVGGKADGKKVSQLVKERLRK